MAGLGALECIRTHSHIRGLGSVATHIGPGRDRWPRLRETERLRHAVARLQARRVLRQCGRRGACRKSAPTG